MKRYLDSERKPLWKDIVDEILDHVGKEYVFKCNILILDSRGLNVHSTFGKK